MGRWGKGEAVSTPDSLQFKCEVTGKPKFSTGLWGEYMNSVAMLVSIVGNHLITLAP